MQDLIKQSSVWILPSLVVAISLLLKIFVNRKTTAPNIVTGLLELPVDIAFISISLTVGFCIGVSGGNIQSTAWLCICFIVSIISVILFRWSLNLFEQENMTFSIFIGTVNGVIAVAVGWFSVEMVVGA